MHRLNIVSSLGLSLLIIMAVLTACTMIPKYRTPKSNVPLAKASENGKVSLLSYHEFFKSDSLRQIVDLTLEHNKDLKIAALNIEVAAGLHGIARANLMPIIGVSASQTRQGVPSAFAGFTPKQQFRASIGFASYEVDLFGKIRSLKESALEEFLSSNQIYSAARLTLITESSDAYLQILLDLELLEIAKEMLKAQEKYHELTLYRYTQGVDPQIVLIAANDALSGARINFETLQNTFEQDLHKIQMLTGFNAQKIPLNNESLENIVFEESKLEFIPSENLLARPDIKKAEHDLKSANANIGAARAAFFPSITLTGSSGYGSRNLDTLFDSRSWSFSPQISIPIFAGGRNMANLDVTHVRKKLQITSYEKAIENAFKEALDQFSARKSLVAQLELQRSIYSNQVRAYEIALERRKVGAASLLDEINARVAMLNAKQNYLITKRYYLANLLGIYKVMGGGSEVVPVPIL